MPQNVLIIGGYGTFGGLIAKSLANNERIQLIVAGRSLIKARGFADQLHSANPIKAVGLDIMDDIEALKRSFAEIKPDIIIHTSGPFQGQNYDVAEAAIAVKAHYIDLADGRAFVEKISAVDEAAKKQGVAVITGASSVPGLSSAVIDHYKTRFETLETVEYGITTAQKTPRGLATTRAILSYVGRPFTTLINGTEKQIVGWNDLRRKYIKNVGYRWFANCDIPDLSLLPEHYPDIKTIRFRAGLELSTLTIGIRILGFFVRLMPFIRLEKAAGFLLKASNWLNLFGSDQSGFYMTMSGLDAEGHNHSEEFQLWAHDGDGLHIPTIPAILLTRKLSDGTLDKAGTMPCVGLITLDEYLEALEHLNIGHSLLPQQSSD